MEQMKVNRIVGYLKSVDFCHDEDQVEEDVRSVLGEYGIWDEFEKEELQELKIEMKLLAIRQELSEVSRLVRKEHGGEDGWVSTI